MSVHYKAKRASTNALVQLESCFTIGWSRSDDLGTVRLGGGKFGHVHHSGRDLSCVPDSGRSVRLGICLGTRGIQTRTCLDCWMDDSGEWGVHARGIR